MSYTYDLSLCKISMF